MTPHKMTGHNMTSQKMTGQKMTGQKMTGQPGASALALWERASVRHRRRVLACRACLAAFVVLVVTGVVSWRVHSALQAPVWAAAVAAGLAFVGLAPHDDPDRWRRGAEGEIATGRLLAQLHGRRWAVFHDLALPGTRANVDHLVIGPSGVWVVDSKHFRALLRCRRGCVLVGRRQLSTEAASFEARAVSDVLGCPVRAVVAVHGEGLPGRGRSQHGVRVLPAYRLVPYLRRRSWLRPVLSRRQVSRLAEIVGTGLGSVQV
jgi:hypothetical protein